MQTYLWYVDVCVVSEADLVVVVFGGVHAGAVPHLHGGG